MCIRALDYCPPVDITFGEYLRALITADFDLVPDDDRLPHRGHRGVPPPRHLSRDVRTLSIESLRWHPPQIDMPDHRRERAGARPAGQP